MLLSNHLPAEQMFKCVLQSKLHLCCSIVPNDFIWVFNYPLTILLLIAPGRV